MDKVVTAAATSTTTTTAPSTTPNNNNNTSSSQTTPATSTTPSNAAATTTTTLRPAELEKIYAWINELCVPSQRENALLELSRQREAVQDLAPFLWHSFGSIAALLQEVYGRLFIC